MFKSDEYADDFDDVYVRHAFICKVLSILCVQMAITTGVIVAFVMSYDVQRFALDNKYIFILCVVGCLIIVIILACCDSVARTVPINYILLFTFTVCESYMVGFLASKYEPNVVLAAFGITAVMVLALAVFAKVSCCDFTAFRGIMLAFLVLLLIVTIICMFFPSRTLMFILCGLGIFIFSIYLIIDIQMMIGGNHKNEFGPDDYIFAALSIYMDVINLFLYILILLGLLDN